MEEQGLKIDKNVVELIGIAEDTLTGPQFRRFISPVVGEIYRQAELKDIEIQKLQEQLAKHKENYKSVIGELEEIKKQLERKECVVADAKEE